MCRGGDILQQLQNKFAFHLHWKTKTTNQDGSIIHGNIVSVGTRFPVDTKKTRKWYFASQLTIWLKFLFKPKQKIIISFNEKTTSIRS